MVVIVIAVFAMMFMLAAMWDLLNIYTGVGIVILCCVYLWVMKTYNIIGAAHGVKLAEQDKKKYVDNQNKIKFIMKILANLETAAEKLGVPPSEAVLFEWDFILMRVTKPIEEVNRRIKAIELIGIFRIVTVIALMAGGTVFLMTFNVVGLIIALISILVPSLAKMAFTAMIAAQDRELERDFPDLFLLLYCSLMGGVNSRISGSLADYTRSCNALYGPEEKKVIRQFVQDLQNNIEIYADEPTALVHMREKYRSALVVNFCNTATQALRGVPMEDKLLNFKIELQAKQKDMMEKEAHARIEKGRKVLLLVYVILFEFVVLSWASKLF